MVITRELTNTASASTASDIQLGSCVTEIGRGAFSGYTNLGEVELPDGLTTIGEAAFSGSSISSVEFPSSLSAISNAAFSTCSGLTEVTINSGVTSVGNYAFSTCSNISSCTVDSASIGSYAFRNCNKMQRINLGSNVSSIGTSAFTGNYIKKLIIEATTPPTLSGDSLYGNYLIYVPYSSYNDYITDWASYKNRIVYDDFPYKAQFFSSEGVENIIPCNSSTNISQSDVNNLMTSATTKIVFGDCLSSLDNYAFRDKTQINEVEWTSGITSIGNYAFGEMDADLGDVTLGENVSYIGGGAFRNNRFNNLTIIGNSSTSVNYDAFYECSINNLTIGSGITSLSQEMFYNTSGYTSLTIPSNITTIGLNCFHNGRYSSYSNSGANEDLREISIFGNPTFICHSYYKYNGCFNGLSNLSSMVLSNVTNIPPYFATHITGLTRVNSETEGKAYFPNVVSFSANSFCNITNSFEELEIGSAITSFSTTYEGSSPASIVPPFNNCDRLRKVHIVGNSNTVLDNYIFKDKYSTGSQTWYFNSKIEEFAIDNAANIGLRGCSALTKVTLGNGITNASIPNGAFSGSTNLTEVNFSPSMTTVPNYMFSGCTSLSNITLPSGITSISDGAFASCGFSTIEIPNQITSIGANAFASNSATTISIGSGLTTIGSSAFYNCGSLTSVIIPSNVLSIGNSAFAWCSNLSSVMMSRTTPPVIGTSVFDNTQAIIYVPASSYDLYVNAENWPNYRSRIVPIGSDYKALLMGTNPTVIFCNDDTTLTQAEVGTNTSISYFTAGNCITAIGASAFTNAYTINGFSLSSGVTSIGERAFRRCNLTRLDANSFGGVETIGYQAFSGCSNLESVEFPSSLRVLGNEAFRFCNHLSSVTFPDDSQLTTIGVDVFSNGTYAGNSTIKSFVVPSGVTSVGQLTIPSNNVTFKSMTPPTIQIGTTGYVSKSPFINEMSSSNTVKIYVPCNARDAFIAPWQVSDGTTYTPNPDNVIGYGDYEKTEVVQGKYVCENGNKYQMIGHFMSADNVNFCLSWYEAGELIEADSKECVNAKAKLYYSYGGTYELPCNSSQVLTYNEIRNNSAITPSAIVSAVYGQCISGDSYNSSSTDGPFARLSSLRHLYFDSSIKRLCGTTWKGSSNLEDITFYGDTPPDMSYIDWSTFNQPIYVPYAAVDTYKAHSGFTDVASYVQPIIVDEKWESEEGFICDGGNKYGKLARWVSYDGTTYIKAEETKPDYDDLIESGSSVCVLHTDVQTGSTDFRYSGSSVSSTTFLSNITSNSGWKASTVITVSGCSTYTFYGGITYCEDSSGSELIVNNINDLTTPSDSCSSLIVGDGIASNCKVHGVITLVWRVYDTSKQFTFYNLDPTVEYKIKVTFHLNGYSNSCRSQGYITIPNGGVLTIS